MNSDFGQEIIQSVIDLKMMKGLSIRDVYTLIRDGVTLTDISVNPRILNNYFSDAEANYLLRINQDLLD